MTTETEKVESKLSKEEYISLVEMFSELLNAYGLFAESLGKVQKEHKDAYHDMFSPTAMEKLPEVLLKAASGDMPPQLGQLVISIFAKMAAFLPQVSNMMELSADQKIKLGANLKSLSKDFKKLQEWVEKLEKS